MEYIILCIMCIMDMYYFEQNLYQVILNLSPICADFSFTSELISIPEMADEMWI